MILDKVIEIKGCELSCSYATEMKYWSIWSNRRKDWIEPSKRLEDTIMELLLKR